jgi:hypothetical protein
VCRRIAHHALDIGLGQEAQEINALRRHIGVGGEADQRQAARARDLAGRGDGVGEQRADDRAGAFVRRLLGRALRAPCELPPSSLTMIWRSAPPLSSIASSAALRSACAASAALPEAPSGRIIATRGAARADDIGRLVRRDRLLRRECRGGRRLGDGAAAGREQRTRDAQCADAQRATEGRKSEYAHRQCLPAPSAPLALLGCPAP